MILGVGHNHVGYGCDEKLEKIASAILPYANDRQDW